MISKTKTVIVLLLVTILSLGFYTYMLARPISYGMSYYNETVYEGMKFEGMMVFHSDGTLTSHNSNFPEEQTGYYYYRDGYIFALLAETEEEYEAEVAHINANFEEALAMPFYASKINAFRHISLETDDYATAYTCTSAVIFAVAGGIVELVLLALTVISFVSSKKARCKEM